MQTTWQRLNMSLSWALGLTKAVADAGGQIGPQAHQALGPSPAGAIQARVL